MALDNLDDTGRIRTVADQIAQKRVALRALFARMAQTCVQRFEVGVNVGKQGDQ